MNTVNVEVQKDRKQPIVLDFQGFVLYLTLDGATEIAEKLQQAIQDLTMKTCEGCGTPFPVEEMVHLHDAGYSVCNECYDNYVHNCATCGTQWLQADMVEDAHYTRFCPLHDPLVTSDAHIVEIPEFDRLKETI